MKPFFLFLFVLVTIVDRKVQAREVAGVSLSAAFAEARLFSHPLHDGSGERILFNDWHGLAARISSAEFVVSFTGLGETRTMRWRTVAFGYGDRPVKTTQGEVSSEGASVEIRRTGITEWLINRREGIEHGYTLNHRPAGPKEGPLQVWIDVCGGEGAGLNENRQEIALIKEDEVGEWNYGKLKVWDASGRVLSSSFRAREGGFAIEVDDAGALYPITIDPLFARTDFIKSSNTGSGDRFGTSVSTDGTVAVIGAPGESGSATTVNGADDNGKSMAGAAYVFRLVDGSWVFEAYLKASNSDDGDEFGRSVGVDGDLVVVGARNEDGSSGGVNGPDNDGLENSGAAYVFARSGGVWSQQAYLKAGTPGLGDLFGHSVAVSGERVIVGAYFEDGSTGGINGTVNEGRLNSGAAYIFQRTNGSTWAQEAYVKASVPGSPDNFGLSVAMDGDLIIVGAPLEAGGASGVNGNETDNSLSGAGAAYLFSREAGNWEQVAYLKASNPGSMDQFGWSVAVDGDSAIVGARNEDGSTTLVDGPSDDAAADAGAAYVFRRGPSGWVGMAYLKAPNMDAGDLFGHSVALEGDFAMVGAEHEEGSSGVVDGPFDNGTIQAGAVYVFRSTESGYVNQAYLKAPNPGGGNNFGSALSVAGELILVGEPFEDSNTSGINPVQTNSGASASGAVHVFRLLKPKLEIRGLRPFKPTGLRKKSKPLRLLVANTGGAPLEGLSISITGKARRDFKVSGLPAKNIGAGTSGSFSITFKPRKPGSRTATLTVLSNASTQVLPLKGKGKGVAR
ncbi:MAG: hypothetical protein JNJ70_02250 [Verrucomicrobiales bacterium]|nr:hypothetical protein [Verrucomicrobiales bacterium]